MYSETIFPRLATGSTIQVIANEKKYKVEFNNISRRYEFINENFYQNVFKTEIEVKNLIRFNRIIILNDGLGDVWADKGKVN